VGTSGLTGDRRLRLVGTGAADHKVRSFAGAELRLGFKLVGPYAGGVDAVAGPERELVAAAFVANQLGRARLTRCRGLRQALTGEPNPTPQSAHAAGCPSH